MAGALATLITAALTSETGRTAARKSASLTCGTQPAHFAGRAMGRSVSQPPGRHCQRL